MKHCAGVRPLVHARSQRRSQLARRYTVYMGSKQHNVIHSKDAGEPHRPTPSLLSQVFPVPDANWVYGACCEAVKLSQACRLGRVAGPDVCTDSWLLEP
jgi:hypothetical protein